MNSHISNLVTYLPALGYLAVVSLILWGWRRCPTWVHPVALVGLLPVAVLGSGIYPTLTAAGISLAVFVVLLYTMGDRITGTSILTLTVTLALSPIQNWIGVAAGLLLVTLVACVNIRRVLGRDHIGLLAVRTFTAIGVNPAGTLVAPDLEGIPYGTVDVHDGTTTASKMRIYLAPYLFAGVALVLAIATL